MSDSPGVNVAQLVRHIAKSDHYRWCRASYGWVNRLPLLASPHTALICQQVDRVLSGEINRLLINMPPRHGKTETCVTGVSTRVLAVNPQARLMHTSYSDNLVQKNSRAIQLVLGTRQFVDCFPETRISRDSRGRKHWNTTAGGEFHAASQRSEITGFECGRGPDPWDGLLIIDDPEKASDMTSAPYRNATKDNVGQVISTRLNHDLTPVIVIQQRLHADDCSNWLLSGGTGDVWTTLCLQALSDTGRPPEHYRDYSHCDLVDYHIEPGALWPARRGVEALLKIRDAREDDSSKEPRGARVFQAQYQQNPGGVATAMYDKAWLQWYATDDIPWSLSEMVLRIDTAQKGGAAADFHGMALLGHDKRDDSQIYVLAADQKRAEFPALVEWVVTECKRIAALQTQTLKFTSIIIEDANIGAALMAVLKVRLNEERIRVNVSLTPSYGSKFERAAEALPYWQQGRVLFPSERTRFMGAEGMVGIGSLEVQYATFTEADTHASDDILDCVVWHVVSVFGGAGGSRFAYGSKGSK